MREVALRTLKASADVQLFSVMSIMFYRREFDVFSRARCRRIKVGLFMTQESRFTVFNLLFLT